MSTQRTIQHLHQDGWFIPASEGVWEYWPVVNSNDVSLGVPVAPILGSGKVFLVRGSAEERMAAMPYECEPDGQVRQQHAESIRVLAPGVWRLRRYIEPTDPEIEGVLP